MENCMIAQNAEINEKLLRKSEVAERLACSPRTVDREASCGRLTRVKVRGAVRFLETEVQAIMRGNKL